MTANQPYKWLVKVVQGAVVVLPQLLQLVVEGEAVVRRLAGSRTFLGLPGLH